MFHGIDLPPAQPKWINFTYIGCGVVAGLVLGATCRRPRSQAQGAVRYANMVQCAGSILTQEGVGAFFLGIQPTLIRSVPNLGIQFLLYELLNRSIGF